MSGKAGRPGGRTNGAGRAPRPSRPRGSNKGPTSGGCLKVVVYTGWALAALTILALGRWGWR